MDTVLRLSDHWQVATMAESKTKAQPRVAFPNASGEIMLEFSVYLGYVLIDFGESKMGKNHASYGAAKGLRIDFECRNDISETGRFASFARQISQMVVS